MSVDTVTANAATQIANAIGRAARSTGASFEYLLTTAHIESNLDPLLGMAGKHDDGDVGI